MDDQHRSLAVFLRPVAFCVFNQKALQTNRWVVRRNGTALVLPDATCLNVESNFQQLACACSNCVDLVTSCFGDVVNALLGLVLDATDKDLIRPFGNHVVALPDVFVCVVDVVNPVICFMQLAVFGIGRKNSHD